MIIETRAYARAGLLGNPSDGYYGKTISIIVRNFGAHVYLYESPELHIEPQEQDINIFRSIHDLVESIDLVGYYGGTRLIQAAIRRFYRYCQDQNMKLDNRNFTIRYHSSIPRQVGLAGSSAIITATIRALMTFYDINISKEIFPSIVLSVETEELGINAGLQDRVIQTYEGCVYMDFNKKMVKKTGHGHYESLNPSLLPKLFIAYKTELGKESGKMFNNVRSRYEEGDDFVISTLNRIAEIAEEGKKAIGEKDTRRLMDLMNENFDQRCKIINISESNLEMVRAARACGASAKFAGSGGSIIGVYEDDEMLTQLIVTLKKINARVIKPFII